MALQASGAFGYNWLPTTNLSIINAPTSYCIAQDDITYTVIGTDTFNSCPQQLSFKITVDEAPTFMPSIFSPNGDGINDLFKIGAKSYIQLIEFRIFNRWGQEMFSSININEGWDGKYKGQACEMDTYFYTAKVAFPKTGFTRDIKGEVILTR
jgi:gliding motility-associated-like protein